MTKTDKQTLASCLIRKYFDASSTLEEERLLRLLLADTTIVGTDADEARAVMGLMAAGRIAAYTTRRRRNDRLIAIGSVAASVAVLVTIAIGAMRQARMEDARMTAYVGGTPITDHQIVMELVDRDLALFAGATAEADMQLDAELSVIGDMLN